MSKSPTKQNVSMRRQHDIFMLKAHELLRKPSKKTGKVFDWTHVVYTNFNTAFKTFFGVESREAIDRARGDNTINAFLAKGGLIYKPNSTCGANLNNAEKAFATEVETFINDFLTKKEEGGKKKAANGIEAEIGKLMLAGKIDEASRLAAQHRVVPDQKE